MNLLKKDENWLKEQIIQRLKELNWQEIKKNKLTERYNNSHSFLYKESFVNQLQKLNPQINFTEKLISQIKDEIFANNNLSLIEINKKNHQLMISGINLLGYPPIQVFNFQVINDNCFQFLSEFSITGQKWSKRPDLVLFINGLPLIVIELKSPSLGSIEDAFNQIKNYQTNIPQLFWFNFINIITNEHAQSDETFNEEGKKYCWDCNNWQETKYGTLTAGNMNEFWYWREKKSEQKISSLLETDLLKPTVILDLLENFTFHYKSGKKVNKIIAGYHQYFAAQIFKKQLTNISQKRKGIIQHTQGSGKSFLMIFLTKQIFQLSPNSTIIIITDRNALDEQITKKFRQTEYFFHQEIITIENRKDLQATLKKQKQGGIIFHTIQKSDSQITEPWNKREDIFVIVDEAHRSWYGEKAKLDKSFEESYGLAKWIFTSLPKANYLGLTATPIEDNERSTFQVFGSTIHHYTREEAVEDKLTVKIICYNQFVPFDKDKTKIKEITEDSEYLRKMISKFYQHYLTMISQVVCDKAIIVAGSKVAACRIYQLLQEKVIAGHENKLYGQVRVDISDITSEENNDYLQEMRSIIGSPKERNEWLRDFRNEEKDNIKLIIIVDKHTVGFDMPQLQLMYIDKYINQFHALEQTIMRVNRRYPNKRQGMIIDFIGLGKNLKKINTLINYEGLSELAQEALRELESKLPDWVHNYEREETRKKLADWMWENQVFYLLLKQKCRIFRSYLECSREENNFNLEKKKMKYFLQLSDYLNKARQGKIVNYKEKKENKKSDFSPYEDTISEDIDKLLFQAKKVYDSRLRVVFLRSWLENTRPKLERISLKASRIITKKVNSVLAEYNNYEELAASLIRIVQESQDILKQSSQYDNQEEYPYYYILQSHSLQKSQALSKKIVECIEEKKGKNIDWLKGNSKIPAFNNWLRELLVPICPPERCEKVIADIIEQVQNTGLNYQNIQDYKADWW